MCREVPLPTLFLEPRSAEIGKGIRKALGLSLAEVTTLTLLPSQNAVWSWSMVILYSEDFPFPSSPLNSTGLAWTQGLAVAWVSAGIAPWPAGIGLVFLAFVPMEKRQTTYHFTPCSSTERRLGPIDVEKGSRERTQPRPQGLWRQGGPQLHLGLQGPSEAPGKAGRHPAGGSRLCRSGAV